jgi:methylated-DNA-[protein]-cysteine S-methyltransferase
MAITYYDSIVGLLLIEERYGKIVKLEVVDYKTQKDELNPVLENVIMQLDEYFMGKRREFDVEVEMFGTPYMLKVWEELKKIPYGTTISYQELARRVGNEKGARSAGGACGKNSVMIIVPCHRVIGKDGSLVGFGGGLGVKQKLLELEYRNLN